MYCSNDKLDRSVDFIKTILKSQNKVYFEGCIGPMWTLYEPQRVICKTMVHIDIILHIPAEIIGCCISASFRITLTFWSHLKSLIPDVHVEVEGTLGLLWLWSVIVLTVCLLTDNPALEKNNTLVN